MRCTRRLLDRSSGFARYSSSALLILTVSSCASEEDSRGDDGGDDAGAESSTATDGAVGDGGTSDAARDAALEGGAPRPVVCASSPCATSLVTTLGVDNSDRAEGFCALLDDGTVACWGANTAGQLGRGGDAGSDESAEAARVVGLPPIATLDHTCAVDKTGAIWCWGTGPFLRNDAGAVTTEHTPVRLPIAKAKRAAMGQQVGCADVDDGLLCWGTNTFGQLGPIGSTSAVRSIALPPGAPIRDVLVGRASFVLRQDGTTLSWGDNPPLGRVSSLLPDPHPMAVALGGISSMELTSESACAVAGGIGYCWGRVVDAERLARALPEPVVAPEPIVQISTTRASSTFEHGSGLVEPQRWCAVGASGAVYCWGYNAGGQAGDGTKVHAFDAVEVKGLPEAAAQVKTMPNATCALLTNGKVYCFGTNYYGQLGNRKLRVPSLVPQEVVLP